MTHDDGLFDLTDYRTGSRKARKRDPLIEAVALDREASLIMGDDGQLARVVALHSLDKAHYARYYADIVGTGMRRAYGGPLAWIELYAGPGRLYVKGLEQFKPGSPVEAVQGIRHRFSHYVFADLDPRCTAALDARVGHLPGVHVREGDANSAALHDEIVRLVPKNALVVLYADPAELNLHFDTLRFFAERYKHLDLLLNFPVPGVDRALSGGYDEKASKVLGHAEPIKLLAAPNARTSIREAFKRQLGALGYEHFGVQQIRLHANNSPLYDLMLASREARAGEFFDEAIRHPPGGQRTMELF
jgi:three-Cys-motif partner protein